MNAFLAASAAERLLVVVADEQVGADADALPSEVEKQEVVGEDEGQHRRREEGLDGEVPAVAGVALHVAQRVDLDHQADEADNRQHDGGKLVEGEADAQLEVGEGDPVGAGVPGLKLAAGRQGVGEVFEDEEEEHEGSGDGEDGEPVALARQVLADQYEDGRRRGGRIAGISHACSMPIVTRPPS